MNVGSEYFSVNNIFKIFLLVFANVVFKGT